MRPEAPLDVARASEEVREDHLRQSDGSQRVGRRLGVRDTAPAGGEARELDQRHELHCRQTETKDDDWREDARDPQKPAFCRGQPRYRSDGQPHGDFRPTSRPSCSLTKTSRSTALS